MISRYLNIYVQIYVQRQKTIRGLCEWNLYGIAYFPADIIVIWNSWPNSNKKLYIKVYIVVGITFLGWFIATFVIFNESFLIWVLVYSILALIGSVIVHSIQNKAQQKTKVSLRL